MKNTLLFTRSLATAILAIFMFLPVLLLGQGTENFTNLPTTSGSSYLSRSWTGTNSVTWTAEVARTDQTINGKAICFGTTSLGKVTSPTYSGGMGTLTFKYVRAFTGTNDRFLEVYVNSVKIGSTITVSTSSDVVVDYSANINVTGNVVLEIRSTGPGQVKVDEISWTAFAGSNDPNLAITGTTAHGSVCPGTAASPITYTITNSGTIAAEGISVASSDAQFVVSALSSTTIAAGGGTATYMVTFTPSSAGAKTATITVTSSTSGSNSPTSALTGTGSATVAQAISSSSAGSITAQGATLNGNVTALGVCPAATERGFVYSVTATDATPRVGESGVTKAVVAGIATGAYNLAVTGLLSSTNYSFTSYVYNGTSYTYGTDRTFTTLDALAISGTTAHGSICPSISATPQTYIITNNGAIQVDGITAISSGTNAADFVVSGLSSTTIAAGGTATYVVTFTPATSGSKSATITVSSTTAGISNATSNLTGTGVTPATAAVTTSAATAVTLTTATINGNLTTLGVCPATTEKGFVYSITSNNSDPIVGGSGVTKTSVAGLSTGTFNLGLTGLPNGTAYSFKAYVYDGSSYTYGSVLTFTTTTPPANDLCSGALVIPCGGSLTVNNALATDDVLPAVSCGSTGANFKGIWFTVTPSASGSVTVSSCATTPSFDTYMRIYTGTCGSFATCVDYNDDGCGTTSGPSVLTFSATANTTYYILVTSYLTSSSGPITISATCPIDPPVATAASAITSSGFTANWNTVAGATGGYKLDVSTSPTFSIAGLATLTEGFNAGTTAPSGWTFTGINSTYTSVGNFGVSSPSLSLDNTADAVQTPVLAGAATQFSFWIKGQSVNATSALLVEGYNGSSWVTIQNITNTIPTTGTTYTYNSGTTPSLPANIVQFRFTYTKSNGNVGLDDISYTYNGSVPSFVSGYGDLSVAGTSQPVGSLSSNTTYYYRVRAVGSTSTSVNSNVITVTTALPEPTNHPTNFTATANTTNSITLAWTDATGTQLPQNYLIKAAVSPASPTAPVDGTPEANGALVQNVAYGVQTYTFTGLTPNTTYNFTIWPYTNTGASINYKTDGTPASTTASTQASSAGYFKSKASTGWSQLTTWDYCATENGTYTAATFIPTLSDNVLIQNPHNVSIETTLGYCNNLTIQAGASLYINPGKNLTVAGALSNNLATGLVIKSNASGTGSLKHSTELINATVERYITGDENLTLKKYHLVGYPFRANYLSSEWTGSYLFDLSEANGTWSAVGANSNYQCYSNKGYMIYYPAASTTYIHTGELNANTSNLPVTRTVTSAYPGYNLLPNPYPCAIDFNVGAAWSSNIQDNKIWCWSASNGNYGAFIRSGSGTLGVTNIIPVGQAFFVQATASGDVTIATTAKTHSSQAYYKTTEATSNLLRLKTSANTFADEIIVQFRPDATTGYDAAMEAIKMTGQQEAPQLSATSTDGNNLSINALPFSNEDVIVPLNFSLVPAGEVSFTASGMESFESSVPMYLEDLAQSKVINLREQPTYAFSHTGGDAGQRFQLRFKGVNSTQEQPAAIPGSVFVSQGNLYIDVPSMQQNTVKVSVFDALGRALSTGTHTMSGMMQIPAPVAAGVYVVRVQDGNKIFTAKVVVQ